MIDLLKKIFQRAIDCKMPENKEELQKQQESFFFDCIGRNLGSECYNDIGIDSVFCNNTSISNVIQKFGLFDYSKISPFITTQGLTTMKPLFIGRTSGTSDGNNGGKDIPITQLSLENGEKRAIKNTLCSIVFQQGGTFLVQGKALVLSGSFNGTRGYISGIINYNAGFVGDLVTYPTKDILSESDRIIKKKKIIKDIRENKITITSIHGVPTWPLELLCDMVEQDRELAKKTFANITYISIGGGPPLDYKKRYKDFFNSIDISHEIAYTNNHNATEGFFGSQQRNFIDLDFHWMRPHIRGNWFGYITLGNYENSELGTIIGLHEVVPGIEYVQVVLNDRIPVPYIVKDIVIFNDVGEYIVTGRIGMASNIANEHIEQKHILECLNALNKKYSDYSDYFAIAGMELSQSNELRFHRVIELRDAELGQAKIHNSLQPIIIEDFIHNWFIEHHEQYAGFVKRGKIIGVRVKIVGSGQIIHYLKKLGRWHEQSKIPHIGNRNYEEILADWM